MSNTNMPEPNTEIVEHDGKQYEVNHDELDPNGEPTMVEIPPPEEQ